MKRAKVSTQLVRPAAHALLTVPWLRHRCYLCLPAIWMWNKLRIFFKKTGDSPLFKTWRADYKNYYDTYFFSPFFSGDIIGLYNESLPSNHITGVVCSISSKLITISIDDSFEDLDQESTYFVVKLANDITYKRLKR